MHAGASQGYSLDASLMITSNLVNKGTPVQRGM
jgi:hypothetical protein